MIPFDELVQALDRYRRRQAGEQVPAAPEAPQGRGAGGRNAPSERSAEINLDEVETE